MKGNIGITKAGLPTLKVWKRDYVGVINLVGLHAFRTSRVKG